MQFNDLGKQWSTIREQALEKVDALGYQGAYINGKLVSEFEEEFAKYFNAKYAIGVSNGTDGLKLALQIYYLDENDAVIIPANTFIADYLAIRNIPTHNRPGKYGPKTILIDHDEYFTIDTDQLEIFLKSNRKKYNKVVVIPVHLYGHACDMDKIVDLSKQYNFKIIEDCSQSHETRYKGNHLGSYGDIAVYSLYPGKNLGALGDAGIMTTNDESINERLKMIRNYGSKVKYYYDEIGHNHRLDSIQALFLLEKLKHLKNWTNEKIRIVERFNNEIKNNKIILPIKSDYCEHSYHIYCLRVEDRKIFETYMADNKIPTIIHYPIPIHKTSIFDKKRDIVYSSANTDKYADKIISIPIHPFLTKEEVDHIIITINNYK